MRIFGIAPWLLAGTLLVGCATEGETPDPVEVADAQAVIYDDLVGTIETLPAERGPEIDYLVLTPEQVVLVADIRDAREIIDHGHPLPEPQGGLHRMVIVDHDDLAFFAEAHARWIDYDSETLLAEGEDGTVREWPIE